MSKMTTYRLTVLVMALFFVEKCCCQVDSDVVFTPDKLSLTPNTSSTGGSMQIKCEAKNAVSAIVGLTIYRRLDSSGPSDDREAVVTAVTGGDNDGTPQLKIAIPGASVSGSVSDKFITLSLTQAKCKDAGNYTCRVAFLKGGDIYESTENFKHLSVEVSAGPILLTPTPRGINNWKVHEILSMLCNGPVGTVEDDTKIEWVWQYKNGSILGSQWRDYDGDSSDITDGEPLSQECYEYRSSTLERNLTLADTERIYRCYIKRNTLPLIQFAATHAVGTVTTTGLVSTTPTNPSPGGDQPSKGDAGPIIGGVIGGLVVLVVVIVVIVVIIRRRKNKDKGGDYAADDPSNKSSDTTGPYTTTSSEVTYSQPHRRGDREGDREPRGVTNTALDHVGDKTFSYEPKPARYANDFGQNRNYHPGRRNQAYDSDADSHGRRHHSNDDGDTHSRSNISHESIGVGDPTIGTAI